MLTCALPIAVGMLFAGAAPDTGAGRSAAFGADDVLAKTRAAYAALTSYADSGTVLSEVAGFTNRSTFRTLFIRDPRYLLIDYRFVASEYTSGYRLPGGARIVIWMEKGELQTWNSKTQEHETYPADGGHQVDALKYANYGTTGISVLIPSHLYSKSGLASIVHATEEAQADGFETVEGRRCFRIRGVERWRYPNGRETGVRPISLWIDAETYLIHKIVEDTPRGAPRGSIDRQIFSIKYQINPKLEPAQFHFDAPES